MIMSLYALMNHQILYLIYSNLKERNYNVFTIFFHYIALNR